VRNVFYSFHYKPDSHRAAKVRNIGTITGNTPASDNDWEEIKKGGDAAIKTWINGQLTGRTCAVVLVGAQTAGRKWINYEIKKAWDDGKGVLGIYVHNLTDLWGATTDMGANPFDKFTVGTQGLASIVKCYNPPYTTSSYVYNHIADNVAGWIEKAIEIRKQY
jgi:hypothetical protein